MLTKLYNSCIVSRLLQVRPRAGSTASSNRSFGTSAIEHPKYPRELDWSSRMFTWFSRAKARTPVARRNARPSFKPCLTVLEDRTVPALTSFSIEALPDNHLTPGAANVAVLQFTAKGTDPRAALVSLHVDDVVEGSLTKVANATLWWESAPGVWTALDSSPVTRTHGGFIGFNNFRINVGDYDGERFQVRVNAISPGFQSVHIEVGIASAGLAWGGTRVYNSVPAPSGTNTDEEVHAPTSRTYQRTLHNIAPLTDVSVTANDRDKVVFDVWKFASDPRAFQRCIRLITLDGSNLSFVRTASLYLEMSPGVWNRIMTVRPDGYGRLIFTHYERGINIPLAGKGAHFQVRVDADPTMVGSMSVNVGQYFSTAAFAGRYVFNSYTPQVNNGGGGGNTNPPTTGPLSTSSLFYAAQPGLNVRLADMNIGVGSANAAFNQLSVTLTSGSWTSASNITLRRTDSSGNPVGPSLGTITSNNGTTVVIGNIGAIISSSVTQSFSFALFADITSPLQIGTVFAIG